MKIKNYCTIEQYNSESSVLNSTIKEWNKYHNNVMFALLQLQIFPGHIQSISVSFKIELSEYNYEFIWKKIEHQTGELVGKLPYWTIETRVASMYQYVGFQT